VKTLKKSLLVFAISAFSSPLIFAAANGTHVSAADASVARNTVTKVEQSAADQPTIQGAPGVAATNKPTAPAPVLYGITIPSVLVSDNPPQTHEYSAIVWYHPQKWSWQNDHVNLFIAGSFAHWWSKGAEAYPSINIYALFPIVRFYPIKTKYFSPFIEASVGPAYMSHTQFGNRNLGMHYTFQDELGVGFVMGDSAGFYASFNILHYSNGALSAHNSGITVPLVFNFGYQFN
jgi:hypothetical protein